MKKGKNKKKKKAGGFYEKVKVRPIKSSSRVAVKKARKATRKANKKK